MIAIGSAGVGSSSEVKHNVAGGRITVVVVPAPVSQLLVQLFAVSGPQPGFNGTKPVSPGAPSKPTLCLAPLPPLPPPGTEDLPPKPLPGPGTLPPWPPVLGDGSLLPPQPTQNAR